MSKNWVCYLLALRNSRKETCRGWKLVEAAPRNGERQSWGPVRPLARQLFSHKLLPVGCSLLRFREREPAPGFHDAAEPR